MRVIVLDGGYLMHKGIFAAISMPQMSPQFLYLRMIAGLLKQVKYQPKIDMVIVAHDGRDSWRKEYSLEYKANREGERCNAKPKEWWEATYKNFQESIKRYDLSLPFHFITIDRIEADDIGAVCARYFSKCEVILITKDKDWHQLAAYENVKVFNPNEKKYEVIENPKGILDEKVETGDKSDNILGKCKTEEQRKNRILIMSLLELPEDIELKVKLELGNIKNKDYQLEIENLGFPSVKKQYYKLFGKENPNEVQEQPGEVKW
jgi:5'-3' exonuclease